MAEQLDVKRIQSLVEEAVSDGATSVEEIHRAIASAPLSVLAQIEPLSDVAAAAQDISNRSIGAIYDTIRSVNEHVGVFAEQILSAGTEVGDAAAKSATKTGKAVGAAGK